MSARSVEIRTGALPGANPANPPVSPPVVQNPQRDQLVFQNTTGRITLLGEHGPVTFSVRIFRKNSQGQDVEHPLTNDLVRRIEAALHDQALSGAEIDQTHSLKLNFSRTRRNGAEPPSFNFTRLSRREIGRAAEMDVPVNAASTHVVNLVAQLTLCENAHIQREQSRSNQNNSQAQPGGQGHNSSPVNSQSGQQSRITLRQPEEYAADGQAAERQRAEHEAMLARQAQEERLAEFQRQAAHRTVNPARNDTGAGLWPTTERRGMGQVQQGRSREAPVQQSSVQIEEASDDDLP